MNNFEIHQLEIRFVIFISFFFFFSPFLKRMYDRYVHLSSVLMFGYRVFSEQLIFEKKCKYVLRFFFFLQLLLIFLFTVFRLLVKCALLGLLQKPQTPAQVFRADVLKIFRAYSPYCLPSFQRPVLRGILCRKNFEHFYSFWWIFKFL